MAGYHEALKEEKAKNEAALAKRKASREGLSPDVQLLFLFFSELVFVCVCVGTWTLVLE